MPDSVMLGKWHYQPLVIELQIALGDTEDARHNLQERVKNLTSPLEKSSIATSFVRLGEYDMAIELAHQIADQPTKGYQLGGIAESLWQAGEKERAKSLLASLGNTSDDLAGHRRVARSLVENDQLAELKQWLIEMPSPTRRVYACVGAINGLAQKKRDLASNTKD